MNGMGTFSYMSNNYLTLALNSRSIKMPISLIALRLASLICFFFFMLTSIFGLIKSFWSSLFTCVFRPMVVKLLDCVYNISTFVFGVPFDFLVNVGLKVNDGIKGLDDRVEGPLYIELIVGVRVVDLGT